MQEATTFNVFYDAISFQHLASVLIFVLRYATEPGNLLVAHPVQTEVTVLL